MPAELEILEVSVFNICLNTLVFRVFTDIKRQKPAITKHILAYLGVVSKFHALFCLAKPNPILPASTIALRELTSCQQRLRVSQGPFRLKSGTFKPEIGLTSHGYVMGSSWIYRFTWFARSFILSWLSVAPIHLELLSNSCILAATGKTEEGWKCSLPLP